MGEGQGRAGESPAGLPVIHADGPASFWEKAAIAGSGLLAVGIIVTWVYLIYRLKRRGRL